MTMTLVQANQLIAGALESARERSANPLAVIVLDSGGHYVAFQREDGASLFRHGIAKAKAMGALGMGMDTRLLAQRAAKNPLFFTSVSAITDGNLALSPGGILIRNANKQLLGAVGISGDTADIDESCAMAGIEAAGLYYGDQT